MFKRNIFSLLGVAALISSAALAATDTANLGVSATVADTCVVLTPNALTFGPYDTFTGAEVLGNAVFTVQCTNGMDAPPVTMGQGLNDTAGSAAAPQRQLLATVGHTLTYNLYSNPGATIVWENVIGVAAPTPDGTAQNMTVYGKIDSGQTAATVGTYTDTVVVTVTF